MDKVCASNLDVDRRYKEYVEIDEKIRIIKRVRNLQKALIRGTKKRMNSSFESSQGHLKIDPKALVKQSRKKQAMNGISNEISRHDRSVSDSSALNLTGRMQGGSRHEPGNNEDWVFYGDNAKGGNSNAVFNKANDASVVNASVDNSRNMTIDELQREFGDRDQGRDRVRDRSRDRDYDRDLDRERDRDRSRDRNYDRDYDRDRYRDRDYDRDRYRDRDYDRDRGRDRSRDRDYDRDRDRNYDRDRDRNYDRDRSRERSGDRGRGRSRDRQRSRD